MKRLDVVINHGLRGVIDPYTQAVESEDGDFVWWDEAENELDKLRPSASDRTALATAVIELKERLGALRAAYAPGTEAYLAQSFKDYIAAVEAAIEVVERLRGGK